MLCRFSIRCGRYPLSGPCGLFLAKNVPPVVDRTFCPCVSMAWCHQRHLVKARCGSSTGRFSRQRRPLRHHSRRSLSWCPFGFKPVRHRRSRVWATRGYHFGRVARPPRGTQGASARGLSVGSRRTEGGNSGRGCTRHRTPGLALP